MPSCTLLFPLNYLLFYLKTHCTHACLFSRILLSNLTFCKNLKSPSPMKHNTVNITKSYSCASVCLSQEPDFCDCVHVLQNLCLFWEAGHVTTLLPPLQPLSHKTRETRYFLQSGGINEGATQPKLFFHPPPPNPPSPFPLILISART